MAQTRDWHGMKDMSARLLKERTGADVDTWNERIRNEGFADEQQLRAWLGVQGEKEDSNRRESTKREGTRVVHEEVDKKGGRSEYTVILGNRFVVSAEGNADIAALKSAVNGLDLAKLEALK